MIHYNYQNNNNNNNKIYEGEATRLAELALIFIPIYNVALSDTSHSKLHYK